MCGQLCKGICKEYQDHISGCFSIEFLRLELRLLRVPCIVLVLGLRRRCVADNLLSQVAIEVVCLLLLHSHLQEHFLLR